MFNNMKLELKQEIHDFKDNIDARLSSLESSTTEKVKNVIRDEMSGASQHVNTEVARLDNRLDRINCIYRCDKGKPGMKCLQPASM